jgi:hypothetical protein
MIRLITLLFVAGWITGGKVDLFVQNKLYPNEFALGDVSLLDGLLKHARDLNIQVLLKYDTRKECQRYEISVEKKFNVFLKVL